MNEEPRMTLRVTEVMALQDRISALEATNVALVERQALLMNVVEKVYRWSDHVYGEGNAEDWYEIATRGSSMSQWALIAQIRSAGPARGYPVSIGTFASESEVRAAYRQAMRDLAEGGYSEDVVDFAIGMPPHRSGTRERTAEADQMYQAFTQGVLNL